MTAALVNHSLGIERQYWLENLIRDRCVGERDVGQRMPILNQGRDALIRDRTVGQRTLDNVYHTESELHKRKSVLTPENWMHSWLSVKQLN